MNRHPMSLVRGDYALIALLAVLFGFMLALVAATAYAGPGGNPHPGGGSNQLNCSINDPGPVASGVEVEFTSMVSGGTPPYTYMWTFENADPSQANTADASTTFNESGNQNVQLSVTDSKNGKARQCADSLMVAVGEPPFGNPVARGDTYATPFNKELVVRSSRISGVLYNDFDTDEVTGDSTHSNEGLTAVLAGGPSNGTLSKDENNDGMPDGALNPGDEFTGAFIYTPNGTQGDNDNDNFTYQAKDADDNLSNEAIVNIHITSNQPDYKILMNYELGMHCTGFEFSYCCVLPPYNSIVAQVVKPQEANGLPYPSSNAGYPRLLTADPNNGLDALGRETVLRDYDGAGNIHRYYLEYYHDAQPRLEGNMPGSFNDTTSTLISAVEGNSLLYWNTPFDSAWVDTDGSVTGVPGKLVTGDYGGLHDVIQGDGDYTDNTDNYANGWLNHLYIYADLEGTIPGDTSLETDKLRLGVSGHVEYPQDTGAALQPMGPTGNGTPFDNVLTFSGDSGTVVYTQMKVLENLPIMLTSPRIWEALGLPTTAFEDSIGFFADPGAVDEDTIRPFVAMKAQLFNANCDEATGVCSKGLPVMGSDGNPVIGFGTSPIDIPNCERCHSAPAYQDDGITPNVNSPAWVRRQDGPKPYYGPSGETLEAMVDMEIEYWKMLYGLTGEPGNTDWYARLKGAAISIEVMHDYDIGTNFTANYPVADGDNPLGLPPEKAALSQNTRMGHEAVICQRCHADNVIAVVKSASKGFSGGPPVPPMSEAIHNAHRRQSAGGPIAFSDSLGRFGGCQGCHPAHRSDGVTDNYPITPHGSNFNAMGDNRLGAGGCFVGRDVHSNPLKDVDGAETPEHLNAVGEWLRDNVSQNQAGLGGSDEDFRGIWCTNCHQQLSQEIWRAEDCNDLIHGDCLVNPRGAASLGALAGMLGTDEAQVKAWLDPNSMDLHGTGIATDFTHAIWNLAPQNYPDANVATIEVGPDGPVGSTDDDGDFSVNILSFCTTDDCVDRINANKGDQGQWRYPANPFMDTANTAVAVPFSAADDARDHWLAPGEPHCADCHAAPYTEQSGNITFFPPFNYPAKASLMRYTRGHQDISCQGCHESIHGLYPVAPAIDNTSYAQAAALNADGSHGPLKCGTCHKAEENGVPSWIAGGDGGFALNYKNNYDAAVGFAHQYTAEFTVLGSTCQNCHGDHRDDIGADNAEYLMHAYGTSPVLPARASRLMMDNAEIEEIGHVLGDEAGAERDTLCSTCHGGGTNRLGSVTCSAVWRQHLTQGRVSESVWEDVSLDETGTRCGW